MCKQKDKAVLSYLFVLIIFTILNMFDNTNFFDLIYFVLLGMVFFKYYIEYIKLKDR